MYECIVSKLISLIISVKLTIHLYPRARLHRLLGDNAFRIWYVKKLPVVIYWDLFNLSLQWHCVRTSQPLSFRTADGLEPPCSSFSGGVVGNLYFEETFGLANSAGKIDTKKYDDLSSNVVSVLQAGAFFGALISAPVSGRFISSPSQLYLKPTSKVWA